jgi:fructose-bisphosphate aldolase class I
MNRSELERIARAMVAPGRGILAADESTGTIKKRFDAIKVENTEENRRAYRELLFTATGMAEHISGVIMYDETIRQAADDGTPFPEFLANEGILPGIKVDTGAKPLAGFPRETVTEGLDGLRDRLRDYRDLGARFAKWRAVVRIDTGLPTRGCLEANAHALARYAALCQEAGMVPIVEPEVLMDGEHTIDRSEEVTTEVLRTVFDRLAQQRILLEGIVLKPNMLLSGYDSAVQAGVEEVAERTLACFSHFRRIRFCYERKGEHFQALHELAACCLVVTRLRSHEL